jgi:mRNA interferase MazF
MVGIGHAPVAPGPRRGDVHFVDFPDLGGHVIKGPHPAVVVRTDRMQRSTTVIVIPMTSTARSLPEQPPYLVPVAGRESGMPRDGFAKCDQVLTFPASILGPRAGRLNPAALARVDAALRFVLDV